MGHDIFSQGLKTYLVWPIIFIPGIENMPKFWALSCWQNADPCPTPWPAGPSHRPLLFIGNKRKHLVLAPPLCCFLLAPSRFPLKLWCWESQIIILCHHPSQRSPHSSLGSASWLLMWKSTVCHHHLCNPPPYYHYLIWVTAIITTLTCGVLHMIIEQYSCCFV